LYRLVIRPLLFVLPAESAHHLTLTLLHWLLKIPFSKVIARSFFSIQPPKSEKIIFGLQFPNPVGLAAGFDKNAKYIDDLACLGFGFIEIGTVTPLPQPGNEKPRLFRLPKDQAIINRMGFNNDGMEIISERLKKRKSKVIIGGNIGKNKITPNENAVDDYVKCFDCLFEWVDYFVVNVSSPNTPGLRELQEKGPLLNILNTLQEKNNQKSQRKPILLKIAPDLTNEQLDEIIEIVRQSKIDGLIATNTTISREGLQTGKQAIDSIGNGGLSGLPLKERATEVIQYIYQNSNGEIPIIGVGGIMSAEDALEKMKVGASLVQVYSGFIYKGAGIVKEIVTAKIP